VNTEETKAADALWEDYPNFKRPIVPIEFVDAFLPKIKEKGLSEVRITGELSPFNADFKCHVALVSRESWTSNPTKMYDLHVAAFDLKHMPGCGGILMSHGSYVSHSKRRTGLGDLMQEMKMWIASQLEAGMLLATVVVGNEAEEAILGKHGWQPIGPTFRNVHTENNVQMWQKILT
jgi:hypothetical protein